MIMQLSLAYSPCPNDTFMFDAMVHGRLCRTMQFAEPALMDIEHLNGKAGLSEYDITKISYAQFFNVKDQYQLLHSGSALGRNCGPLLIAKRNIDLYNADLTVAIPGYHTTANQLLKFAFPHIQHRVELCFSEIEEAVSGGKVDLGLIIHESRFTYQQKGLIKIADLGEIWEEKTGSPIPLGGIVVRRNLDDKVKKEIDGLLKASIEYAFHHPEVSLPYCRSHAQEMDDAVMQSHIHLYVNEYSVDIGIDGMEAVRILGESILERTISDEELRSYFI